MHSTLRSTGQCAPAKDASAARIAPARGAVALQNAHRVSPADDPDFYPTPPWGARAGAELVLALDPQARTAWEPACGIGTMVHGLGPWFSQVWASDAYSYDGNAIWDFTQDGPGPVQADWIFSNPPFSLAEVFIRLALARARRGVAMLMRVAALETISRHPLMYGERGHAVFAPFCERLPMHRGRYEPDGSTAAFYAWFIWFAAGVGFARPQVMGQARPVTIEIPPGTCARLTRPEDAELFGVRG